MEAMTLCVTEADGAHGELKSRTLQFSERVTVAAAGRRKQSKGRRRILIFGTVCSRQLKMNECRSVSIISGAALTSSFAVVFLESSSSFDRSGSKTKVGALGLARFHMAAVFLINTSALLCHINTVFRGRNQGFCSLFDDSHGVGP